MTKLNIYNIGQLNRNLVRFPFEGNLKAEIFLLIYLIAPVIMEIFQICFPTISLKGKKEIIF
jgi:hypothetical protein